MKRLHWLLVVLCWFGWTAQAALAAPAVTIRWLGHACFLVSAANGAQVLMDPYNPAVGYPVVPQTADVVTISHEHFDHNNLTMAKGKPVVLRGLGGGGKSWAKVDRTVKGIHIRSVGVYHDDVQGKKRGLDAVFLLDVGGVRIAHLGDLGHLLTAQQISAIGPVDVLMVPVGGFFTISGEQAEQVVKQLHPRLIIPMHYKTEATDPSLPIVNAENFLKAHQHPVKYPLQLGVKLLSLDKGHLLQPNTVIMMDYRQAIAPAVNIAPPSATPVAEVTPAPSAPPLAWSPQVRQQLDTFLSQTKGGVATFDADGTIWADDVGEAFFRFLIADRKLLNVDYSKDLWAEYERRVKENKLKGYAWVVQLMAGLRESDVQQWAADFFRDVFQTRIYGPQKEIIEQLKAHGVEPWIVSASNRWIIEAGAPYVGVDPKHTIGVRLVVQNGILTDRLDGPFPYREGKEEAIKKYIGKQPVYASGDSGGDEFMLKYSSGLATLLIHDPAAKSSMVDLARQHHWLLQYFPLLPPWQAKGK